MGERKAICDGDVGELGIPVSSHGFAIGHHVNQVDQRLTALDLKGWGLPCRGSVLSRRPPQSYVQLVVNNNLLSTNMQNTKQCTIN